MDTTGNITNNYLGQQLATHLREVHLGGNWCEHNYRAILCDLSVDEINDTGFSTNSILKLCYHTHYYVKVLGDVLNGNDLNSKDAESFLHPEIKTEQELQAFIAMILNTAETTAQLLEKKSNVQLLDFFSAEKYGSTFRNAFGFIEHLNYHLGQLVLLKMRLRKVT